MVDLNLKRRILQISHKYRLSHLGSYFSSIDILDKIYSKLEKDDIFILSSGHAAIAMYCCIEKYFGIDAESMFLKHGGHPHRDEDNHIHCSTGSLGLGITIALGRAIANPKRKVYVLISDGECAEGSVWESLKTIKEQNIKNIEVYVNINGYAAYGEVDREYLTDRLKSFLPEINICNTRVNHLSFLKGLNAHYHVMNDYDFLQGNVELEHDSIIHGRSLSSEVDIIKYSKRNSGNILEIGCYDGYNLKILSEKYFDKIIYGIDPFISDGYVGSEKETLLSEQENNLYKNILRKENVKFYKGTTNQFRETNPNLKKMNISFIFIDGSHHYDDIKIDISLALDCIVHNKNKKGTIVFHDNNIPDVIRSVHEFEKFMNDNNYKIIQINDNCAFAFDVDLNTGNV